MSQIIKVIGIQQTCSTEKAQSFEITKTLIKQASKQSPDLIVLQELHATDYFCQTQEPNKFDLAEPLDGPTAQFLSAQAKNSNAVIVGSIFERRAAGIYHNTALVFERDGSLAGFYRKMHIPDDPGFYEKYYFTPGDPDGFEPIQTSIGKLGVMVCWDQWYPEGARIMALKGAQILIYPTAIGWDDTDTPDEQTRQKDAWIGVQRGHSIANNLPVVAINRVGHEPDPSNQSSGIKFWGHSFITGPQGEFLDIAEHQETCLIQAEIDFNKTEKTRRIWPYFRDRRIDAYTGLQSRYIKD
ncbi:carbon-nitrogen hydrolase [Oceaniserpentilla sp. 4NH20-0058]|uniref:carbon-nitrogen hydrolase n=1 Tax=Oceaniserpentilla sp. 4NH20-0058 TaxID=3127660 RepID=UPI0031033159